MKLYLLIHQNDLLQKSEHVFYLKYKFAYLLDPFFFTEETGG